MRLPTLLPLLAIVTLTGCDTWLVETRTRIDAGAHLSREARIAHLEDGKPVKGDGAAVEGRFRLLDGARRVDGRDEVVMTTEAGSPREAPADFVLRLPTATARPEPCNAIDWRREDCVLFDRYVYRETFKDSVDEADRDAATEALFEYVREVVVTAARLEVGDGADTTRLEAYVDGPGRRLFGDLARIALVEKDGTRRDRRIAARLGAEGIAVPEKGSPDEAIKRFIEEKLGELLAPYRPERLFEKDPDGKTALDLLLEEAAARIHGSREAAEQQLDELLGALSGDVDRESIDFVARVTMPGRVLRTNGAVDEDGGEATALWRFAARDVARTGHVLELETIVRRSEVLCRLPRPKATLEVEDVVQVIDLLCGLDGDARARLSDAFVALDRRPVEEVRAGLDARLGEKFDALVKIGTREE